MKKILPNVGRPQIREKPTPAPLRVPRKRRKRKEKPKNFLMRHVWYNGWGVIGLTGLALFYENKPEWAKKSVSVYIFLWLAGAISLPSFLSSRKNPEEGDQSIKIEIDID